MVNTHFWKDAYVRTLIAGDKLLFLYLMTNPSTNIAGAYEIALDEIASDIGMTEKRILESFERFTEAGKLVYKDHWILIQNFIKHQSKSETVEKGIIEALSNCPQWIKDTVSVAYPYLAIYLNPKSNLKPKPKRKFKPDPRAEEVFQEWKTVLNKKSALDLKRQKVILARLDEGLTVDELKLVPHGAARSSWHQGGNPNGKKYLEISTLFRDREQCEKFIDLAAIPATPANATSTQEELKRRLETQVRKDRPLPQIG